MVLRRLALLAALLVAYSSGARADIYTWTDENGVTHFTNIKPKGKRKPAGADVRTLYKTGPGKAGAARGDCPRCDVVPSRDSSPERFHRYDAYIAEASALYQLPETLIRAVMKVESDYDPRVVSSMDARGLMQLMPEVCDDMHVPRAEVHEPRINILGGTRLLRVLANRFNGDLVLTIAGYHAGAGAVTKYGGVPPYEHTQKYVRMVLAQYEKEQRKAAQRAP